MSETMEKPRRSYVVACQQIIITKISETYQHSTPLIELFVIKATNKEDARRLMLEDIATNPDHANLKVLGDDHINTVFEFEGDTASYLDTFGVAELLGINKFS